MSVTNPERTWGQKNTVTLPTSEILLAYGYTSAQVTDVWVTLKRVINTPDSAAVFAKQMTLHPDNISYNTATEEITCNILATDYTAIDTGVLYFLSFQLLLADGEKLEPQPSYWRANPRGITFLPEGVTS